MESFNGFTKQEHKDNLKRLKINHYEDLLNKEVHYVKETYGIHKVLLFDDVSGDYLLGIDEYTFWTNPFRIILIEKS